MKRIMLSALMALLLMTVLALPALAAVEQTTTASVSVSEVISITLTDAGTSGINFGSQTPPVTAVGDSDQSDGTPAIRVNVGSETNVNVDIGIKGAIASGTLALENWLYSKDFAKTSIAGLTASYVGIYSNVAAGSANSFYHWITVPSGTVVGSHTVSVSYKAVKTGMSF